VCGWLELVFVKAVVWVSSVQRHWDLFFQ